MPQYKSISIRGLYKWCGYYVLSNLFFTNGLPRWGKCINWLLLCPQFRFTSLGVILGILFQSIKKNNSPSSDNLIFNLPGIISEIYTAFFLITLPGWDGIMVCNSIFLPPAGAGCLTAPLFDSD